MSALPAPHYPLLFLTCVTLGCNLSCHPAEPVAEPRQYQMAELRDAIAVAVHSEYSNKPKRDDNFAIVVDESVLKRLPPEYAAIHRERWQRSQELYKNERFDVVYVAEEHFRELDRTANSLTVTPAVAVSAATDALWRDGARPPFVIQWVDPVVRDVTRKGFHVRIKTLPLIAVSGTSVEITSGGPYLTIEVSYWP